MSEPYGIAVDDSGNVYVANMGMSGGVSKFSSNGTFLDIISEDYAAGVAIGNYLTANGTTPSGIALAPSASDTATLNLGTYGGSDTTATLTTPFIAFGNGTAALNLNLTGNYTLSAALTGGNSNSTLNQLGTGTTTLTSANSTYAGAITVNAGTLAVTGSLANATTQVNSGGTLAGNGTLGAVIINDGGTIAPGNSPGNITVGNLTLNAGAIYNWQTSSNGTSGTAGTDWDLISSPGTLTLNATSGSPITINLSSLGNATLAGVKKTSWEIGNFTTGITGFDKNAFSFNAASMIGNAGSYFMSLGTGNLTLVLNYKTGAVWNTASGNWSTASQWEGNSLPENGDSIEFSGPGGLSTNNFASGNLSYISGISFLEGSGAYTVNGSTLQIKEDGIINSSNQTQTIAMDLTSNGLLTVNAASGNLVLSGVFSGNWQHNLEKTGNATLTLTGNNTYEGGTIISAGTLNVASAQALGTAGSITFGGGTLRYGEGITTDYSSRFANQEGQALLIDTWSPNNTVIFASNITAANGTLTKLGAGALVLRGNNSYNGGTVIAGGTLAAQSAMAFGTGNVDLNNNSVLAIGSFANGLANMALSVGGNLSWSSNTSTIALLNGASANITGSLSSNGVVGNRTFDVSQYGVVSNNTITLARFADSDILTSGTSTANATFDITFTGLSQSSTVTTTGNFVISDGVLKYLISSAIANGSSLDIRNSDADFIVDSPTTAGTTVVTGQNPLVKDVIFKGSNNLVVPTGVELTVFGQTGTAAGQLEVQNGTSSVVSGSGTIQAPNGLEKVGGGELDLQSNTNVTGIATVVEGLLSVNGQLATTGGVVVNPGATLGGTGVIFGNVVVNGNFSPGNSPGTETIIGNLVLTGANATTIEIASPTNFDRIVVTGTATLGGKLNAVGYGGYTIAPGSRFDFLQAGSIVGAYDSIIAPEGLRARFLNSGTVGTLLFGPGSYVMMAINQNQRNVAKALDSFILATSGDRLTVSLALDSLTTEQFPSAFDQIMPGFYESLGDILIEQTYNQAQLLTQRLGTVRLGAVGFQAIGMSQPIKYDKDGKSAADAKTASPIVESAIATNWNSWVIANGEFSISRGLSGVPNYNNNAGGFLVGADYRLSENFAAGLFAGYEYSYAKYDGGSSTRGNSALFGLYGSYTHEDGYYADAMVSGGYTGFQTRRSIKFSTIDRTASADPNSGQFSAALNLGKDFEIGKFTLGPIIGAQYTYAGIGGFTETGADSLDLALGQQNANSLRTNLGARLAYNWEVGSNITLIPEVRGFWMHEFLNNPRNISSALDGGSGASFDYETSAPYRNSVFGGVGISAKFADRWSASVFYNVNFGAEGYTNNIISTSLGFSF
jgi:outer membrane autotransporter protein